MEGPRPFFKAKEYESDGGLRFNHDCNWFFSEYYYHRLVYYIDMHWRRIRFGNDEFFY